MTRPRSNRPWPRMKYRGKHRRAELTVFDADGRVIERGYRPNTWGGLRLTKRNGIRAMVTICPGAERGCRHCWEEGF